MPLPLLNQIKAPSLFFLYINEDKDSLSEIDECQK